MKNYLVGVIFFLLLGFLFQFTIIERTDTKKKYPYKLKLYYPKIDGLKIGTDVHLRGVPFGIISEIKKVPYTDIYSPRFLNPSNEFVIELTLEVKEPVTLWENYQVKFKTKTLFSGRLIDIDPGDFHEGSGVHFKPTYQPPNSSPDHSPSADYYEDFFGGAYNMLEENRNDTRRIVINLRQTSEKLKGNKGTLPKLLNEEELYNHSNETIVDLSIIAKEARRYVESQREFDNIPTTFVMVMILNALGINLLSQGQ